MLFGSYSGFWVRFQMNRFSGRYKKEPGPSHPALLKEEKKNHPFCLSLTFKPILLSVAPLIADEFIIVQEHDRQIKSQKFPQHFWVSAI
jgi:hypothetical protein